jgi:RHS repeat-associated protein
MNYQYDPAGNVAQLEYNRRQGQEWVQSLEVFAYDWLDRLVSAQGDYGLLSYSYDPAGNRLSQNDLTYIYNTMNELTSMSDGTMFTYDDNGNMITRTDTATWAYTYDTNNLLTQVEKNQQIVAQYVYDGCNKRVEKTEWIESLQEYQTIIYVYSGSNVIYERNVDTGQQALYVHGPTGKIAKKVDGLQNHYHTDHLGSTRLITDESGNPVADVQYKPFGETVNEQNERYLYNGKERDSSGLYYYGARYYDPEIGRFITRDPLKGKTEAPQTLNRYVYCLNNPLKYIDPSGNEPKTPQEIVEEIFQQMSNIDEDSLAEIQELMNAGQYIKALKVALDALGFTYEETNKKDTLGIYLEGRQYVEITFNNSLRVGGLPAWGNFDHHTNTISINFSLCTKVGDTLLTILHEISHAVLFGRFGDRHYEDDIIYSVEYSFRLAYDVFLGVEFSDRFIDHLNTQILVRDPSLLRETPTPEIMERWLPHTGDVIA